MQSNLSDARDAFINVVVDVLSAYKLSLNQGSVSASLLAPESLKLLPLYIVALLKHVSTFCIPLFFIISVRTRVKLNLFRYT